MNAHPYAVHDPTQGSPNDFRARFHRPLVAPSPFRTGVMGEQQASMQPAASASSSISAAANASVPPENGAGNNLDPQLGQARDEAVGVAKQLERS